MINTPIYRGLAQSDLDMAGFNLLNWYGGPGGGSGTSTITVNVKDAPYSAVGDGVADDTVAIQSAINACAALGGGVVYLPKGVYLCNGPFDPTTNSILKIPYVPIITGGIYNSCMSIELRGEGTASASEAISRSDSCIKSTKTGTGTAPAILAAYTFNGRNLITDYTAAFSNVQVTLRSLQFLTNPDPSIHGVRLDTAVNAILEDVIVEALAVNGVATEPTHGTVGLWMPSTLNFATNHCNRVWCVGFDTGLVASCEHLRAPQINFLNCHLACELLSGGELGWANLMVFMCTSALKFTRLDPAFVNRCPVVLNLQYEYVSSGWQSRTLPDILDSSNCACGELRYFVWGPAGSAEPVITGASDLRLTGVNTAGTTHYFGTDARLVAISGGVKLEVRNASTGVWIEATRYTNP